MELREVVVTEVIKATPPVSGAGLIIYGVQLSDITLVLLALYAVLQLFFLLRDKWWRDRG